MADPGPVPLPTDEANGSADPHRRQSGRAASLVFWVVAGVAVAGLGWALVQALGASNGDGSGGDTIFQVAGHDGASAKTRADRLGGAGRFAGASGDKIAE